ncbi:MAG: DsbA family protein [Pseudomonadota bacterium]
MGIARRVKWFFAAVFLCLAASQVGFAQTSTLTKEDVEAIVRDYILENPEILIEALQAFEQRQAEESLARQQEMLEARMDVLVASEHQIILGNPEGDVTLIEFFDYNCGFCRRSLEDVERLVSEDKNLRVVLKEFPVLGDGSREAAQVAIAAAKQDPKRYLELHKRLLMARGQVNERVALKLSESLGFDMADISETLAKPVVNDAINEVYSLANDLGLTGTPTFIIGTEILPGAVGYDVLREKVDAMRECGRTVCS